MASQLICHPALGQTTVIARKADAKFTVWLEVEDTEDDWAVALWHNCTSDQEWTSLNLSPQNEQEILFMNKPHEPQKSGLGHRVFFGTLTRLSRDQGPSHFTVKYRKNGEAWQWINDHSPQEDGEICFQDFEHISMDFSTYLQVRDSDFYVQSLTNNFDVETQLWSVTAPIEAAHGKHSTFQAYKLGLPSAVMHWFSLVRISRPWLAPRQGRGQFLLSEDAVLTSFLRRDGLHLVILAISIDEVLTVLNSDEQGNIVVIARNDSLNQGRVTVLAAVATTFEDGNTAVMNSAREFIRRTMPTLSEEQPARIGYASKDADAKEPEDWQESLAYCTWNGLGQDLNDEKIMSALKKLAECDVKVTNLIIDDGWQSLDDNGTSPFDRRWTNFDADKSSFPGGLKSTISMIRETYPYVEDIAVWHGMFGYWGGISPSGDIYKRYKTLEVKKQESGLLAGGTMTVVDAEDVFQLYDDFYRFLSEAGINSVKADNQFFLDHLDDANHRRSLTKTYQDAWTLASVKYFELKAISCMSQIPQILFYSQLPAQNPRFTVRNSDDFFPDEPSSHSWHVFCNAHNSVLTQHLNVLPDWDMFQTNHAYSGFHAAARCVSGGFICFTDKPGEHNIDLINEMTAKAPVKRIILRPNVGKTTQVYMSHKDRAFCKIGTYSGPIETASSIMGVFNVGEPSLVELVSLKEFTNIRHDQTYIVRAHTSGKILSRLTPDDHRALMILRLGHWGYEILTAHMLHSFPLQGNQSGLLTEVAVLGLLHKMTGVAAIRGVDMIQENFPLRLSVKVTLKALGILGIFVSDLLRRSVHDSVTLNGKRIPLDLVRTAEDKQILEIDLEAGYKQLQPETDWSSGICVNLLLE